MSHAPYFQIVVVAAIVMGLSHTIAKERLFARMRARLGGQETFVGYLVSCPYCCSHWISFVLVPLTETYALQLNPALGVVGLILRWFLSSIFITVVAAFLRIAFYFLDEGQGLVRREIAKTEAEVRVAQLRAEHEEIRLSAH